jgi:hypothetical protein
MKSRADALGSLKMSPDVQNMKTGPDALGTVKNESDRAKHENRTRNRVLPKTCLGAQNMKMVFDTLCPAKIMSGSGKHVNGI